MDNQTLFNTIQDLIDSRQLAVLCTQKDDPPYASLVAVAATPPDTESPKERPG
jgi:hypothetical protein